jgi:D-alanine transaminase
MDRGFLFADGIYEVSAVINGKLIDNEGHINRLFSSLEKIDIKLNYNFSQIIDFQKTLIEKNNLKEGVIYIQVTRGVEERDFNYKESTTPTFLMFTQVKNILNNPARVGVKAITVPEIRWQRRDIKSIALLAQVMAKNEARKKGAFEAWMIEDGSITEGSSSNAYIVKDNVIITKNLSNQILHGITRKAILALAKNNNIKIEERAFTPAEAYSADECFMTSASTFVVGITELDGKKIGDGEVGKVTKKLYDEYIKLF